MKPFILQLKDLSSPSKKIPLTPNKQDRTQDKKQTHPFMILSQKDDIDQQNSKQARFCMAHLCKSFLQKHNNQEEHLFDSSELLKEFKVKQRRLYDLMNILQGCGCISKISKGKYKWKGKEYNSFPLENQKTDLSSLKHISSSLKLILYNSQIPLSFAQLNNHLIAQKNLNQINPTSIRRRTYQCCKVFTILGYVEKIGKQYIWAGDKDKQKSELIKKENSQKPKSSKIQLKSQQKKIMSDILRKYKTVQDLDEFFQRARDQFIKKQSQESQKQSSPMAMQSDQ